MKIIIKTFGGLWVYSYLCCESYEHKHKRLFNNSIMETTSMVCRAMSNVAVVNCMDTKRMSVIAHRTHNTEIAMVKAMMIANLKEKLQNGIAHFLFVKRDGNLRECYATCSPNYIKTVVNGRGESRENYATTAAWDVKNGKWISFRWETLIRVY